MKKISKNTVVVHRDMSQIVSAEPPISSEQHDKFHKLIEQEFPLEIVSPLLNPDVISIVKQADGNYIGYMQKFGKVIEVRDIDPQTVLVLLLTHDGK